MSVSRKYGIDEWGIFEPELVIIDGNSFAMSTSFAFSLSTKGGEPTQGIYGFLSRLISLAVKYPRAKFFIAWDRGRESFRKQLIPEYKKRRVSEKMKPKFEQYFAQLPKIKQISESLISTLECDVRLENGEVRRLKEADDIIAFFVVHNKKAKKLVVSTDKDFFQLVTDKTAILSKDKVITIENFESELGFPTPARYLEARLAIGDASDKIPGVKGFGEKTAKSLFSRCSLSEFLRGEVEPRNFREEKLLGSGEVLRRNLMVMRLPPKYLSDSLQKVCGYEFRVKPPGFDLPRIAQVLESSEIVSFDPVQVVDMFRGHI